MFLNELKKRVEQFGLDLAMKKTRCIAFERYARSNARQRGEKPKEFTFLGFTHYCGKTKKGYFKVKRRTSCKKLGPKPKEVWGLDTDCPPQTHRR